VIGYIPPGLVTGAALVLFLTQFFHAGWYRGPRRRYLVVLALTAAGVMAGQAWEGLGLPSVRVGQLNVLPAVLFAAALQPFAQRLTQMLPLRLP
jgi:hypothetical protein